MAKSARRLDVAAAESIAILHLLHPVPTLPSANPIRTNLPNEGYSLPFQKERDLTGTLAFLSSVKDDRLHIPAVCIHEVAASKSLDVLVAVNQTIEGDKSTLPATIEKGFNILFSLLSTPDTSKMPRVDIMWLG